MNVSPLVNTEVVLRFLIEVECDHMMSARTLDAKCLSQPQCSNCPSHFLQLVQLSPAGIPEVPQHSLITQLPSTCFEQQRPATPPCNKNGSTTASFSLKDCRLSGVANKAHSMREVNEHLTSITGGSKDYKPRNYP